MLSNLNDRLKSLCGHTCFWQQLLLTYTLGNPIEQTADVFLCVKSPSGDSFIIKTKNQKINAYLCQANVICIMELSS